MKVALLTDFGSTFTKVIAVDLAEAALAGSAQVPTRLDGEILDGYEEAARSALHDAGGRAEVVLELAASSAGGGIRMVAVGLVDSLTTAAASAAALNAGARLVGTFAGSLTEEDARTLAELDPEIVLFAGGTDGGQEGRVLRNAAILAGSLAGAHVVVACNQGIAKRVAAVFEPSARSVTVVANVLPEIGVTCFDAAREAIGRVFIGEVIAGKQLSRSPRFTRLVKMATPNAVLRAAVVHAQARERTTGDGLLVTDIGGATTDVYSVLQRRPVSGSGARRKGFVSSPHMRTVEGDLGLRSSAPGVLRADRGWLERQAGPRGWLTAACERRTAQPGAVFGSGRERELDERLAVSCMFRALERHCGQRAVRPGLAGRPTLVEHGPNLSGCRTLVAGGGIVRASAAGAELAREALGRLPDNVLAPRHCQVIVDRRYVLAAAGLLAKSQPQVAAALLRRELPEEPAHEGQ